MSDLRQILSQGRKRIGLLVGAGAPLAIRVDPAGCLSETGNPLIPGVDELTRTVIAGLESQPALAARAIQKDLGADANIETVLSRIRLLETALGGTPVNGLDGPGYGALAKAICTKIGALVGVELPKERSAYNEIVAWVSRNNSSG